jgi:GrpB-like predicted nucleotidyltransferase (UPF0157 family)
LTIIVPTTLGSAKDFRAEREHLAAAIGPAIVATEHIGSPAVHDAAATPIIDLMVGLGEHA